MTDGSCEITEYYNFMARQSTVPNLREKNRMNGWKI